MFCEEDAGSEVSLVSGVVDDGVTWGDGSLK